MQQPRQHGIDGKEYAFSTCHGWTHRHRGGLPRDDPGTRFRVVVGVLTNIRHNFLSQVSGATGLSPV